MTNQAKWERPGLPNAGKPNVFYSTQVMPNRPKCQMPGMLNAQCQMPGMPIVYFEQNAECWKPAITELFRCVMAGVSMLVQCSGVWVILSQTFRAKADRQTTKPS